MLLQAFSSYSFSKTERNGTQHNSSGVVKNEGGLGRVGSGRVGSGECHSLPDSTQALPFFRSALTIAPFTEHFVLPTERLEQAMLSLDMLSIKAVMQTTTDY